MNFTTQSSCSNSNGLHVALIMDGNGRWARQRNLPRLAGHRAGAAAVRRVVKAAPDLGIDCLTLYAFSSDNWLRPPQEVHGLMRLLRRFLFSEAEELARNGVRLKVIGRRDRLPQYVIEAIDEAEKWTQFGTRLLLRVAVDYSARDAMLEAARRVNVSDEASREQFAARMGEAINDIGPARDVDLLIRTGGEQRLSDFLLWECAYAEFHFTQTRWPDFGGEELSAAVDDFRHRVRRFGRVPEAEAIAI